jgi:hypothetical protein
MLLVSIHEALPLVRLRFEGVNRVLKGSWSRSGKPATLSVLGITLYSLEILSKWSILIISSIDDYTDTWRYMWKRKIP